MYTCERCGISYSRRAPVVESCPRCLAREGIRVALTFKLFKDVPTDADADAPSRRRPTGTGLNQGLEAAVRRRLASRAR